MHFTTLYMCKPGVQQRGGHRLLMKKCTFRSAITSNRYPGWTSERTSEQNNDERGVQITGLVWRAVRSLPSFAKGSICMRVRVHLFSLATDAMHSRLLASFFPLASSRFFANARSLCAFPLSDERQKLPFHLEYCHLLALNAQFTLG